MDQDSYRESSKSLPSLKLKLVVKKKFAETMARQKLWSESDVDRTEGTKGVDSSRDKLWKSFDDSCENDTIPVMEVSSNPADVSGSESDDKRPVRKRRSSFADSFYQVWQLPQFVQLAFVKKITNFPSRQINDPSSGMMLFSLVSASNSAFLMSDP